jgi:transcription initiation factor TFIID subunit 7
VDLPNIIEAQKTDDNRHLFKIADISQMLVVDQPVSSEAAIPPASTNPDDYIWPHGLTPPMRHVRKRRFRKRMSRRTIEVVEEQVEELLMRDDEADEMTYGESTSLIPHPSSVLLVLLKVACGVSCTHLPEPMLSRTTQT